MTQKKKQKLMSVPFTPTTISPSDDGLEEYGLTVGQEVKWCRPHKHKTTVTVLRMEKDGSISCHDERGAFRSIRPELIEIQKTSPRGKILWEKLIQ